MVAYLLNLWLVKPMSENLALVAALANSFVYLQKAGHLSKFLQEPT